ncbi:MAG: MerR family transcriptional regulator, partial [Pseudomonadota bacterium]
MPTSDLSVGEMAARSGVPVSTIHFYEAEGLIESWRTPANHRRYDRRELRRVAIARVALTVGVSLKEVREILDRVPRGRAVSSRTGQRRQCLGRTFWTNGSRCCNGYGIRWVIASGVDACRWTAARFTTPRTCWAKTVPVRDAGPATPKSAGNPLPVAERAGKSTVGG